VAAERLAAFGLYCDKHRTERAVSRPRQRPSP